MKKEDIYEELVEMGKLGIDIKFPKCFRVLEETDVSKWECINTSNAADLILNLC